MIKEIIVVEGKDDTVAIQRAVDAETIETGGSAINEEILRAIELAQERRGVIIFTDPDHAGERIRSIITSRISGCKHAFIDREHAKKRGKIGVEHASSEMIRLALSNVKTEGEPWISSIDWNDLIDAGLISHPQAASRRLVVGKYLGIGYANGKQFYKRITRFHIKKDEFKKALELLENEGRT